MKNLFILLPTILFLLTLISGCSNNTFTDQQINNPEKVVLPINSKNEAIQYSLSLDQVRNELNKPLEGNLEKYNQYPWWARASHREEVRRYLDLETKEWKGYQDVWIITWFKGPGECQSPHGCQITISSEGTFISDLTCSDGWSCE